jgi:outer membrane protein assembly factor BamB
MAQIDSAARPHRKTLLRFWLPVLIILVASITSVAIWTVPSENMSRADRIGFTSLVAVTLTLLLVLWFLCLGSYRFWFRLLLVMALFAFAIGSIRSIHFSGDMEPIVQFRWSPSSDDILEAHRKQQGPASASSSQSIASSLSTDFPEYRNTLRDGVVQGPSLARDWSKHQPRELWRQPSGGGYGGFAVRGDCAVTLEQRRGTEALVCYDGTTGYERWVFAYAASFTEPLGGPGPRATPTIADNRVYSLGATGMLVCLDLSTGKPLWSVNILDDNDNIRWGMSGSPLVYDNVVVVNPGSQRPTAEGRALVAYDRASGAEVWRSGKAKAAYASPMLATLAGERQIIILDAEGLAGFDPGSGKELWRYGWRTEMDINVAQPLVLPGDRIFISSGYHHGCMVVQIAHDAGEWSAKGVWPDAKKTLKCKFTSPVLYQGHIFGLDEGVLTCIDAKTGERTWRQGHYGHGQILLSGDLLLVLSETGKLVLVEATPSAHHELGSEQALASKTWNYPALSQGRVYIRNDQEMACYSLVPMVY